MICNGKTRIEKRHKLCYELSENCKSILDCGFAQFPNRSLKNAVGIDFIEAKKPENYKKVLKADLNKDIPLDDNSFDCIMAGYVVERLYNPFGFLLECKRLLKKNGLLIVSTPNKGVFSLFRKESPFHLHEWEQENFRHLLESETFNFRFVRKFGFTPIIPLLRFCIFLKKLPFLWGDVIFVFKNIKK